MSQDNITPSFLRLENKLLIVAFRNTVVLLVFVPHHNPPLLHHSVDQIYLFTVDRILSHFHRNLFENTKFEIALVSYTNSYEIRLQ